MCTMRRTPARVASATTFSVPRTFTASKLALRSVGTATVCTTISQPSNAVRSVSGRVTSAVTRSRSAAGSSRSAVRGSRTIARMSRGAVSSSRSAMRFLATKPFAPVMATFMTVPPPRVCATYYMAVVSASGACAEGQPGQAEGTRDRVEDSGELATLQAGPHDGVQAQVRRECPADAVHEQEDEPDPPLRRPPPETPPDHVCRRQDDEIPDEVVGDDGVDRSRLAERLGMGVADTPRHARARRSVMLAVDDVADAADREPERDADDRRVEHEAERQAQPAGRDVAGHRRAERRAHRADAAVPDRERL